MCTQELPGVFKNQFLPMVGAEAVIWTPAQYLNFTLLPVQHQQMFVNVMSVVEAAVLSWCASVQAAQVMTHLWRPAACIGEQ
jgi:Mpv17 / PMP22 family